MGLYQVIRSVGFSVGSALTASILAAYLVGAGVVPNEEGYVLALWVGSAVAGLAAVFTLVLGRVSVSPEALGPADSARIGAEDSVLAAAGLVGIEGDETHAA